MLAGFGVVGFELIWLLIVLFFSFIFIRVLFALDCWFTCLQMVLHFVWGCLLFIIAGCVCAVWI